MASWSGQQFGKYVIHEEVGRGGMARVFRATDTSLHRAVALKIMAPSLASDPEYSQRFEREAITAANLHHPNIVTIFDVGEVNGVPYIAMEYIAGRTLQAVIDERGALGLALTTALLAPVAEALDFAHLNRAIHRDVKPQNILINADGRVLLTDFGIAQAPLSGDTKRLTRSGVFMGTPEYIAPEQVTNGAVDGRTDLYSLAVVAFEAITGSVPFSGSVPELLVAHSYTPPPSLSARMSGLPEALDKIFERALAKKPAERPPSGSAFIDALKMVSNRLALALPSRAELAELAIPQGSSAGKSTVALSSLPALALPDPKMTSPATDVGGYPVQQPKPTPQLAPKPVAAPAKPTSSASRAAQPRQRAAPQPRAIAPIGRRISEPVRSVDTQRMVYIVAGMVLLALLVWLFIQQNQGMTPLPPKTGQPATATTSGLTGPFQPLPTDTRIPTEIPTETPTETPTEEPTQVIPATEIPATEVPATEAPTPTTPKVSPTLAPPTPTLTSVPPTITPSPTPPTSIPTEQSLPTITPPFTPNPYPPTTQTLPTIPLPTITPVIPTAVPPTPSPMSPTPIAVSPTPTP